MTGRIKSVYPHYAFVTGEDGVDRFFHRDWLHSSTVNGSGDPQAQEFRDVDLTTVLSGGLVVSFLPVLHATKGPRALNVLLVPNTPGQQ